MVKAYGKDPDGPELRVSYYVLPRPRFRSASFRNMPPSPQYVTPKRPMFRPPPSPGGLALQQNISSAKRKGDIQTGRRREKQQQQQKQQQQPQQQPQQQAQQQPPPPQKQQPPPPPQQQQQQQQPAQQQQQPQQATNAQIWWRANYVKPEDREELKRQKEEEEKKEDEDKNNKDAWAPGMHSINDKNYSEHYDEQLGRYMGDYKTGSVNVVAPCGICDTTERQFKIERRVEGYFWSKFFFCVVVLFCFVCFTFPVLELYFCVCLCIVY
jgi:type IV secretory pathway VirB10-like protein